ncbi:MAG TPA: ABC transporter permease [Gemmatimonadaceae bacterium]|nr:ABC transporter permease [Gemmatimonadaceae bacterium]
MPLRLAILALFRHPARTMLALLGIAVSAALLLDMVMLASGMKENFQGFLMLRGYQLRVSPRGTLPFDSEATVDSASALVNAIRRLPGVAAVSPVLGGQTQTTAHDSSIASFTLAVEPAVQGDYELVRGVDIADSTSLVANERWLELTRKRLGDTVTLSVGYDPQLRTALGQRTFTVRGVARFFYMATSQPTVGMHLATLQRMSGSTRRDRVSLMMVKAADGADAEKVRERIEQVSPRISAISLAGATAQVEQRLAYFRQLALVLGSISLAVGVLLVTTLITIGVNERAGEIAVLRAISIAKGSIVLQVVTEGLVLSGVGAIAGLGIGLVTAQWLERILADFPGMPATFRFFVFQPRDAGVALGMLTAAGILAGIYPAWRAASLPIAVTLRREAVA